MPDYTIANLENDVEDQAPKFGFAPDLETHFAKTALEMSKGGIGLERLTAGFRMPFGHKHREQEEVYVIVSGGGRLKLDDEIIDVKQWDAIRVAGDTMRAFEAGDAGLELIAFGAPRADGDAEMEPGWWSD